MKLFLFFLLCIQASLQQGWSEPSFVEGGSDLAVASLQNRILIVRVVDPYLMQSYSLDNGTTWSHRRISTSASHPALDADSKTGTWILTWVENQTSLIVARSRDPASDSWTRMKEYPTSLTPASVASDQDGRWLVVWIDNSVMKTVRSLDQGVTWNTGGTYPYSNSSSPRLTSNGPNDWFLVVKTSGGQMFARTQGGLSWQATLISNSSSDSRIASNRDDLTMILFGSGDLVVSSNNGLAWSLPQKVSGSGSSVVSVGNQTWLIIDPASALYRSHDHGQTWTKTDLSFSLPDSFYFAVLSDDFYRLVYLVDDRVWSRTYPAPESLVQVVLLNESFLVSRPLVINGSLLVEGSLTVKANLRIEGNLNFTSTDTLNLTHLNSTIEIGETIVYGGTLILPSDGTGTMVLMTFNSSQGNFSSTTGNDCAELEYASTSLIVTFGGRCLEEGIKLWMIIVIVVVSVATLTLATVLMVCFRDKITPFYRRVFYVSRQK